jgi:hypothetical protein
MMRRVEGYKVGQGCPLPLGRLEDLTGALIGARESRQGILCRLGYCRRTFSIFIQSGLTNLEQHMYTNGMDILLHGFITVSCSSAYARPRHQI